MSMEKYGTFVTFQNTETDEVIEIALADEDELNKYANDTNWREIDRPENSDDSEED